MAGRLARLASDETHPEGVSFTKLARTARLLSMITVRALVAPVRAPCQPVNWAPEVTVVIRPTRVPVADGAPHMGLQWMPAGVLVTVPPAQRP